MGKAKAKLQKPKAKEMWHWSECHEHKQGERFVLVGRKGEGHILSMPKDDLEEALNCCLTRSPAQRFEDVELREECQCGCDKGDHDYCDHPGCDTEHCVNCGVEACSEYEEVER